VLRLIGLLLLLAAPAFGADWPLPPSQLYPFLGPLDARGALVWLPGMYGKDQPGPPDPPDIVGRLAGHKLDVFQFARPRGNDPLAGGAETLARCLAELRSRGYRRIVVAGHSRGAWIALTALAHPGLADAIVAISVAAHGTSAERQPQARRDWEVLWGLADAPDTRVVLVQLRDDPYDSDPGWRLGVASEARVRLSSIYLPPEPDGHVGAYAPAFDSLLGAAIEAFADPP
jgi:pimeloyl-ACP methyl ester carboxylesterase